MISPLPPLMSVHGLQKNYGPVRVLKDCNLKLQAGQVHALLGANGAGKSTLVRILAGLTPRTAGGIEWKQKPYAPSHKREAEAAGVQIVQQELCLIPTLTVAENLLFTRLPHMGGVIQRKKLAQLSRKILDAWGLKQIDINQPVSQLGVGQQQLIEIAAALDRECQLLILDEPTAALSGIETELLFSRLVELKQTDVAIIYISHRLDEVSRIADQVSILRDGRIVGTYQRGELAADQMVELMGGKAARTESHQKAGSRDSSKIALQVNQLTGGRVQDVSFHVYQGECFGITGLVGSGRTELLRLIYGADRAISGSLHLGDNSQKVLFSHPAKAVQAGMAMVTEDRKENGLLLPLSIQHNTTLPALGKRFQIAGWLRDRVEKAATRDVLQSLDTRYERFEQHVETLSGGNQQKIAIAKWLVCGANLFLFDEPTRGIDIAARMKIYQLMKSLTAAGKSLVVVSSELEELFKICDRIGVMSNGRLVQVFDRGEWSEEKIMNACFAGYRRQEVNT